MPSTDIRGCMWNRGASVMVCRPDTREVLELRTVHELLHALLDGGPLDTDPDLPPADNMHAWIRASAARCLAHTLTRMFGIRTEAWQRRYYRHLIQAWRNSNV
ncbi:MAG: hypothetical protein QMC96_12545 [Methanomicrobiales archaeon]|nr:hypothetical protein [Methanomicrobiales archaeon]